MAKSLCCLLALVTNYDVANMSFNAHIRVYFRIYSSLCCYRSFYICTLNMLRDEKNKNNKKRNKKKENIMNRIIKSDLHPPPHSKKK